MAPRTVLITGCSSGIGLALAVRLARDKQRRFRGEPWGGPCTLPVPPVIATVRNVSRSGALVAAAGPALGRTLEIKQLDVCDEGSIRACLDSIPGRHVDVLVSNAGVGMIGPLECQSLAAMQGLMDTNFFGLIRLVKEVLPDMKRRRSGHIVVISSVMGLQGIVFNDVYAASKFAVEGFCESLVVQALRFNVAMLRETGPNRTRFHTKITKRGGELIKLTTHRSVVFCFCFSCSCVSGDLQSPSSALRDQAGAGLWKGAPCCQCLAQGGHRELQGYAWEALSEQHTADKCTEILIF
uniref:Retinol dehydrogenase 8 n=1 Tax=Anas zonorhyncha TaxID=75864 RepID=A0A8B9W2F2_9AVES